MISMVKSKKFDVVAVYKVDRIARNVFDFVDIYRDLEKHAVSLISITEGFDPSTPMGKMTMMMLASFADMERMNISQRVSDSMINLAKMGCYTGGTVPQGCTIIKKDGRSFYDITNPELIDLYYNSYLDRGSLYLAYKHLVSLNIKISREGYRKVLRNPIYVKSSTEVSDYLSINGYEIIGECNNINGYSTYGKKTGKKIAMVSTHQGVIEPNTWLDVQLRLDSRKVEFKNTSKVNWLSSVLKCPFCDGYYHLATANGIRYYACQNTIRRTSIGIDKSKEKCINNKYIRADIMEDKILSYIDLLQNKDLFYKYFNSSKGSDKSFLIKLENAISNNNKMINNLIDKLVLLSNSAAKPLTEKIEKLTADNIELNYRLELEKLSIIEKEANSNAIDYIYSTITNFKTITDSSTKRSMLKIISREIQYNPQTDELIFIP